MRSSELLLYKLDDTLQEARAAQEAMTVYLQVVSFVHEIECKMIEFIVQRI